MPLARRMRLGALMLLAIAGLSLALAGSLMAMRGMEIPGGLSHAIGTATSVLAWLRWLAAVALAWGVARARMDPA